ncbi:O-antigen ligase family protein [Marinobacter xiaoshiensis]|uniref:O-antigen ligase family protein n=1 Tax=Marinobacter xiaoshiensis TaxID=3073652 RepID=A0ABU2HEI7_9GAMM|nr:O-antigen ligase family protein [Marinobacter sp. F60267]MDS1309483.1 O-antigen ligase family protein [Marinobacter sp. F60267]
MSVPFIAAALSFPLVLFPLFGYDINPAFLLAPLIGWAFIKDFGQANFLYLLSFLFGIVSILAANHISPDGVLERHFLSLVLIMFSPSFLFLGKYVAKSNDISRVLNWLSIFCSIFLIVISFRILYLGEAVRIYLGPLGLAAMNAKFFNWPVFATFGVLSLAHLVCLQAMIICGALIGGKAGLLSSVLMWVALFCASFLITGSESRSAQILLMWILTSIVFYGVRNSGARYKSVVAFVVILMAAGLAYSNGIEESRMLSSIEAIWENPTTQGKPSEGVRLEKKVDQFTTGRIELAVEGIKEVIASPYVGNGFSSYGRYTSTEVSFSLSQNTSTHIYYLTLLWKGGLVFFVPFLIMILINLRSAIVGTMATEGSAERFFAWAAVLMAFGPMALAWDILIVPSAGAVAFFLFGLLGGLKKSGVVSLTVGGASELPCSVHCDT